MHASLARPEFKITLCKTSLGIGNNLNPDRKVEIATDRLFGHKKKDSHRDRGV